MAQRLDIPTDANWRELARRLKLGTLERAFEIHTSPTIQVLAEYEVCSQLFDASDRLWTCRKYCFVTIMAGISVVRVTPQSDHRVFETGASPISTHGSCGNVLTQTSTVTTS